MAKGKYSQYMEVGNFGAEIILKNLPFVFFLGFLATIYIANAHYSEKKIREIQKLQGDLKELRWHYMSLKSEAMYKSKQSEVAKTVEEAQIKQSKERPKKIIVSSNR